MDTKALRQKILDLAIRGKLVPQDPNDEPASVLLERIRAEKQQMVKDGKLKAKDIKNDSIIFIGEDNYAYEKFPDGTVKCIQDEIPFELPEGWAWCNLSMIGQTNIGLTYHPADISHDGTMVLRSSNIINGKLDLNDLVRVNTNIRENQYVQNNDILICARNGSKALVGKCSIIDDLHERASFGAFMAIYRTSFYQYVYYFLNSKFFRDIFYDSNSTAINQLTQSMIKSARIPLPPLSEQYRIVSKLNKLLTLVDTIESDKSDLQTTIQLTKSKILDLAIRGKLVPQDPNDEPASVLLERIRAEKEELIKQGKIKRDKKESVIFRGEDNSYYEKIGDTVTCIDEELPFKIPDNWAWTRLESACIVNPKNSICDDTLVSFVPMALIQDGYANQFTSEQRKWGDVKKGFTHFAENDVGFAKITPCFENRKSVIFRDLSNGYGAGTTELHILRAFSDTILPEYLLYVVKSEMFISGGKQTFSGAVGQQRVSKEYVYNYLCPVPPLNEQKHIIDKCAEIIQILDRIEKSLK